MRVLIQHIGAPIFWTARGGWTANLSKAVTFLDEVRALDYAFWYDIEDRSFVLTTVEDREVECPFPQAAIIQEHEPCCDEAWHQ
jgi:hypothetical protein